ncbi:DUF6049 family protein [Tessaracoccus sp. Z1128]
MVGRFARALLVGALLALAMALTPRPAEAASGYLDVQLTSVSTPTLDLADDAQVVEVTGTLTNVSTVPIRYVNVHFWRLSTPITSPGQLAQVTEDVPVGARLYDEELGNLDILTRDDEFAPGQRADFTVRTTVGQLTAGQYALTTDDAGYLLGVQVRGIPADGGNQVVGEDHVVVAATTRAVESSALVLLTAPPTWLPEGDFVDGALSSDLSGRLDTLLSSAERDGVTAAVDPALLEAVQRMTEEHVVGGVPTPGSGVALRWLARLDALAAQDRVWRLPYGNPDLARADATGSLDAVLGWSGAATPEEVLELPSVAVMDAAAGEALADRLGSLDTVVVLGTTGSETGTPRLLGAAPPSSLTALPPGVRTGRLIAEELLAERPPLYVIATVEAAEADAAPGTGRRHIAPAATPRSPIVWPDTVAVAPWPDLSATLDDAAGNAEFLRRLLGVEGPADLAALGATAFSKDFPVESAAVAYVESASPARVDSSLITIRAAQSFVMGSRTNTFPATVSNGLGVPIQVLVRFTSDSPQRIRVPEVGPVTVGPGESATVDISPEATANGVAIVRATVTTLDGEPLGAAVPIEITATDFGRVGWIIILVSGAVVVGGTALRIRAVQRERAAKGEQ